MAYIVSVKRVQARPVAVARARLRPRDIPRRFRAELDKVWKFLSHYPSFRAQDRNIFLYHHDADESGAITVDFGVEVARPFGTGGEVFCANTPSGEAAFTIHRGPYAGLRAGHEAVRNWMAQNGLEDGGISWEVYDDWNDDPRKLETEIFYLLR